MRYIFINTCFFVFAIALASGAADASEWKYPPHKLSPPEPRQDHLIHLQIDNSRHGLAVRQTRERRLDVDFIQADGSVTGSFAIDGKLEAIQVNPTLNMAAVSVKKGDPSSGLTTWYLSTAGSTWSDSGLGSQYVLVDVLADGTRLVADNSGKIPVFELRGPKGDTAHKLPLRGITLPSGDDDAGPFLDRFTLLRDGSGFIQRGGTTSRADGKPQSALVTRLWNGRTAVTMVPGGIRRFYGLDPSRIYIQTNDDRLLVAAAGHQPIPVDMHGQSVRNLQWSPDGTLMLLHGNAAFNAETRLGADGRVVSQWVRPKGRLAAGLASSPLTDVLSNLAANGRLQSQAIWSGQRLTSYISDTGRYDKPEQSGEPDAIVISLDGANNFAPQAYAWPDAAAYSPDMRWMLVVKPSGGYAIHPPQPLADNKALTILKRLVPPAP